MNEDWETLYTYEELLDERDGVEKPKDGKAALMEMARKYGG